MSQTALLLLIVCCVALLCIHIAYHRFRHSINIINYSCIRPTHPQLTQLNHFSTSPLQGGIVYNCNSSLFSCIKHSSFSTAPSKARCCANASPPTQQNYGCNEQLRVEAETTMVDNTHLLVT